MNDLSQRFIKAIGAVSVTDWQLRPSLHANGLKPEAGALARVLNSTTLDEPIKIFESEDRAAIAVQKRYKLAAGWAALLSLVAVVIAAALIVVQPIGLASAELIRALVVIQGAALVTSFALSLIVSHTSLFSRWMAHRANAEFWRIEYFKRVLAAKEVHGPNELPLLPLQLEYFRKHQLDVQRRYYDKRGGQHARSVRWGAGLRWLALLLIVAAAIPPVAAGFGFDWQSYLASRGWSSPPIELAIQQRAFIALSTVGAALQGWLAARDLVNQDARNAARYAATLVNLEALAERPLDEARLAAADGDKGRVLQFAALVDQQISSEHREWVDLRSLAPNLSLERLTDRTLPRPPPNGS